MSPERQSTLPAAQLGRQVVIAWRSPDAGDLVGRNAHPQARSADQDPPIHFVIADLSGDHGGDVGVVVVVLIVGSRVDHFLAQPAEQLDQLDPHLHAAMVASHRNSHHPGPPAALPT
jgi:hypothetical protein